MQCIYLYIIATYIRAGKSSCHPIPSAQLGSQVQPHQTSVVSDRCMRQSVVNGNLCAACQCYPRVCCSAYRTQGDCTLHAVMVFYSRHYCGYRTGAIHGSATKRVHSTKSRFSGCTSHIRHLTPEQTASASARWVRVAVVERPGHLLHFHQIHK